MKSEKKISIHYFPAFLFISCLLILPSYRKTDAAVRRIGTRKTSYGPPRVASFLLGLPPRAPHSLKKALRNYHQRLARHHMQFIEVCYL